MPDQDCIFCKIVRGEIPCCKIYETDQVLAFLDIAPIHYKAMHCLSPKTIYATLFDLPVSFGQELFAALQVVGKAVLDGVGAAGLNVGMNNFTAAGQLVHHAHFHLIPRFSDDGLKLWTQTPYDNETVMNRVADSIRNKISA